MKMKINLLDYYESKLSEAVEFDKKKRIQALFFIILRFQNAAGTWKLQLHLQKRSDADMLLKTELALEKKTLKIKLKINYSRVYRKIN